MPRALSIAARQAIFGPQTSEVFLPLITIAHAALSPSLHFVSNTQDVTSRGNLYRGWPFQITLPGEFEDQQPVVQIQIDNVDRLIMEGVRALTSAPTITLEVILASSPDTVEAGPFVFTLKAADYTALYITGTLAFEDVLNEPWPRFLFTPTVAPGLFP
jgi:hypothetical protein